MTQMDADKTKRDTASIPSDGLIPGLVDGRDPQTYAIIGAALEVHKQLGAGFLEQVYHEALAAELTNGNIPHAREVKLVIHYKGAPLNCFYKADFICYGEVLVELKAVDRLANNDDAQVINYLKTTRLKRALLINFGARRLEYKRMVLDF